MSIVWTLVTGGAKRLGRSICLSLAEKKRPLVIHYNQSKEDAVEVAALCEERGSRVSLIQGDFSTYEGACDFITRYSAAFGETETLINNVGNYLVASATKTAPQDWVSLFQVNVHTPFILSSALMPSLIKHKGHIINIGTSGLLRHAAPTYSAAYTMTKQALLQLTLSLAKEMAPHLVKVNMVSPGELSFSVDHNPLPMQRAAEAEEVCRVIDFLLDPRSSYITGQNIEVAGALGL